MIAINPKIQPMILTVFRPFPDCPLVRNHLTIDEKQRAINPKIQKHQQNVNIDQPI